MNETIRTLLCRLAVCAFFSFPGRAAADYEAGRSAANRGEFAVALREWMPLALSGNTDAQFGIGRMYARGDGVNKNFTEALHWFTLAAEKGHAQACTKVGLMYEFGDGVRKDPREAARWYARAAGLGDREARERLGLLKRRGVIPPEPTPTPPPAGQLPESAAVAQAPSISATPLQPRFPAMPSPAATDTIATPAPSSPTTPLPTPEATLANTITRLEPLPTATPDRELLNQLMVDSQ